MASTGMPEEGDTIILERLQLPDGIVAPSGWADADNVAQPATVSVRLKLRGSGFTSAANADTLDGSTVHYGQLGRQIRARTGRDGIAAGSSSSDEAGPARVLGEVFECARKMGTKGKAGCVVSEVDASLELEKASLFAAAVVVRRTSSLGLDAGLLSTAWRVELTGLRMAVLVGVNAHERQGFQPVTAEAACGWESSASDHEPAGPHGLLQLDRDAAAVNALFALERMLLKFVANTAFETLEALAHHSARSLADTLLPRAMPAGGWLRLRFSKPRAIAFADAPAVEVVRRVPAAADRADRAVLDVVRPYV